MPDIQIIQPGTFVDPAALSSFVKANRFLVEFARLFEQSYNEGISTARTKALRRLCKSQLTEVRHALRDLLDDNDTEL